MSSKLNSHHIIPFKYLLGTYLTLIALTAVAIGLSVIDYSKYTLPLPWPTQISSLNLILVMFIACINVSLVVLYFMGLRWDKPLNAVIFVSNIFILFIFFALTLSDVLFRDIFDPLDNKPVPFDSPIHHPANKSHGTH